VTTGNTENHSVSNQFGNTFETLLFSDLRIAETMSNTVAQNIF